MEEFEATAQVCITCLDTDGEMFSMSEYNLCEAYEHLTGYPWYDMDNLKGTLCEECMQKLINFDKFRDKSLEVHALLMDLVEQQKVIDKQRIGLLRAALQQESTAVKQEHDDPLSEMEVEGLHDTKQLASAECKVLLTRLSRAQECALATRVSLRSSFANTDVITNNFGNDDASLECEEKFEVASDVEINATVFNGMDRNELHTSETIERATTRVPLVYPNKKNDLRNIKHNIVSKRSGKNLEEYMFVCERCQREFKRKSVLLEHIATCIKDDSVCDEKKYTSKFYQHDYAENCYLVENVRTNTSDKPHACKVCEYKFKSKCFLKLHMTTHTGEKPFACHLCRYKCRVKYYLIEHMRTHTSEKPFACDLCQYKCKKNSNLVRHMRTHSGDKPFTCGLCQQKFRLKSHLKRHMSTHTCDKPYTCGLCRYKFRAKSHLKRHMLTHTGEKPFACNLCQHTCSTKCQLKTHMTTHTHTHVKNRFL